MRHLHTACLCGALFVALTIAAPSRAGAEHFDPQEYIEAKSKAAAAQQSQNAWRGEAARPLSGGSASISGIPGGTWIAIGVGAGLAALIVVLWLKAPFLNLEPRVDDHIDKEYRAMIEETGEDPCAPEDDFGASRRAPLREDDIIEDLTGERDDRIDDFAGGRET